jgi:threonine 3-dehydrogenase
VNVAREDLKQVMSELHMCEGFDVGLEMSGNPQAFRQMLETMNHGGKVALLGIPPANTAIDWNQVIFKGLEIKGIYGREMFETWYKMVALISPGWISVPSSPITSRWMISSRALPPCCPAKAAR